MRHQFYQPKKRPTARELGVRPEDILGAVCSSSWEILSCNFDPRCCLEATRIGFSVLKHFGIFSEATCSLALAGSPSFAKWRSIGFPEPAPSDAFFVITEKEDNGSGFPGHLVLTGQTSKRGRHFILDLSAPQMHRPEKNILVPEPVVGYMPEPWKGQDEISFTSDTGAVLTYQRHPKPALNWRTLPGWNLPQKHFDVFHAVLNDIIDATLHRLGKSP